MIRLESLKSLLKLKEQNLQVQRADYQRLLDIEQGLQAELRDHRQQVQQFISESQSDSASFSRDILIQNRHYLELLARAEKQLLQKGEQAAQLVKEAFASLNETLQEYRVLERLFERSVASSLVETLNAQFKQDDEMALLAQGGNQ
jgi:hypothetical protein